MRPAETAAPDALAAPGSIEVVYSVLLHLACSGVLRVGCVLEICEIVDCLVNMHLAFNQRSLDWS